LSYNIKPKHSHSFLNNDDILTWRPLRQFNHYRLLLALGLLVLFYKSEWLTYLGSHNPTAYLATTIVLLISSIIYLALSIRGKPELKTQVSIATATDIILITLLTHFSGGLSSSLGILLIINVTATGTFLHSRDSFLFAALASLAILAEQSYSVFSETSNISEYMRAGLLGLVFFGTSFMASTLSARVRQSEQLANERKADIISLEKLNEDIIQNMRTGIIVVDNDGHIRMANSSAKSLLGNIPLQDNPILRDAIPGLDARFLEWREQPQMNQKVIRQQHGLPDIQPGFRKLNKPSDAESNTLIFLEDATQLNQRFQQIKLASLGRLTASIAHEIRNPLSAINHAAQLLQESTLDIADNKLTQIINTQAQRLDQIIKNVMQLSKQEKTNLETIELLPWLTNFKDEFCSTHELNSKQIVITAEPENICILFDSSHLYQIISNLCFNALSHSNKTADEVQIKLFAHVNEARDQPCLDVIDNGSGIQPEMAEHIFEPFFTTSTKGTGLGLFISKEIVESNRARIRYIERESSGSCFRIYFLHAINTIPVSNIEIS